MALLDTLGLVLLVLQVRLSSVPRQRRCRTKPTMGVLGLHELLHKHFHMHYVLALWRSPPSRGNRKRGGTMVSPSGEKCGRRV